VREIEWTARALDDLAALDKDIVRRVKQAVERFAETGAGNVKNSESGSPGVPSARRRLPYPL